MSESHNVNVDVSEPHSDNSSVSEPHTQNVNVSEPHTWNVNVSLTVDYTPSGPLRTGSMGFEAILWQTLD